MKMPNACETIEKLARESQTRKVLEILNECKDLDEAKSKIRELLK